MKEHRVKCGSLYKGAVRPCATLLAKLLHSEKQTNIPTWITFKVKTISQILAIFLTNYTIKYFLTSNFENFILFNILSCVEK